MICRTARSRAAAISAGGRNGNLDCPHMLAARKAVQERRLSEGMSAGGTEEGVGPIRRHAAGIGAPGCAADKRCSSGSGRPWPKSSSGSAGTAFEGGPHPMHLRLPSISPFRAKTLQRPIVFPRKCPSHRARRRPHRMPGWFGRFRVPVIETRSDPRFGRSAKPGRQRRDGGRVSRGQCRRLPVSVRTTSHC